MCLCSYVNELLICFATLSMTMLLESVLWFEMLDFSSFGLFSKADALGLFSKADASGRRPLVRFAQHDNANG